MQNYVSELIHMTLHKTCYCDRLKIMNFSYEIISIGTASKNVLSNYYRSSKYKM